MTALRALVRLAIIALIPLAVIGCATTSRPGFPKQSVDEDLQLKTLEEKFDLVKQLSDYDFKNETEATRNQIITQKLVLMDLQYNRFVSDFAVEKQTIDTITDVILLGLNIGATAVGGAGTKTILSAIATGVSGSKLAVDKNFYYEKTAAALVAAMNAQRKTTLVVILRGMRRPVTEYPLGRALADLDAYYRAGTFLGALQAIQADAGAKERDRDKEIRTLPLVKPEDIPRTEALTLAIGRITDKEVGRTILSKLGVNTTSLTELPDIKERLQDEVRDADSTRLKVIDEAFKSAGLPTQ